MQDVAALDNLGLSRRQLRVGGRVFSPGKDRGLATLLTGTSWLLARLPGMVVKRQRAELIRTSHQSRNLIEVEVSPAAVVRVRDGARLLVEIPATAP
jgi:hypothetical protein